MKLKEMLNDRVKDYLELPRLGRQRSGKQIIEETSMLYNTDWEKTKTKPDVFSLESLIAWLEKMPTDQEYEFIDCEGACLLGQYMAHVKEPWSIELYSEIAQHMLNRHDGLTFSVGAQFPRTFGAALERARAAL